ncbi:MAG TPA: PP2C family serine/threonine-protein phosphatase [Pyrinomonadaceae bacterium]|jgi:serine/threonine protein phosphatase PrpC
MKADERARLWQATGRSVLGALHERSGRPNQDAISWLPESGRGLPLVLAVADGHGSARYFRSEAGAQLAVSTATQVVRDFLLGQAGTESLSVAKRAAEEWLPKALVRRWLEAVYEHLAAHPLTQRELELLAAANLPALDQSSPAKLSLADLSVIYGATLLVAAVAEGFILYLQLGDGEILAVSEKGTVTRPLPQDERLFANETTSLCAPDAWRDFRICFQTVNAAPPALILLSTDGYSNSFRDDRSFLQVGSDLLELIRQQGLRKIKTDLAAWLSESTYAGSGDDATLGLICHAPAIELDQQRASQVQTAQLDDEEDQKEKEDEEEAQAHSSVQAASADAAAVSEV